MKYQHLALAIGLFVLTACSTVTVPLPPGVLQDLQPLERGERIYRGDVFVSATASPAFCYERFVDHAESEATWSSTHITRAADTHTLAVVQRAIHTRNYVLHSFEEAHAQTGTASSVYVHGDGSLEFRVTRDGRTELVREASDSKAADVVVGPTLFGYVLAHWDKLVDGQDLSVRFAVTERAASYAFTLSRTNAPDGSVAIQMEASDFFVRLVTDPMKMTFDSHRRIVRYDGAIPPRGTELEALFGRVEYDFVTTQYY